MGLLGGSFNPAHAGHAHVAHLALTHLGLDEIWFLVSPQNPLKPTAGMAPFAERFASAARLSGPRLRPAAIETALGTRFTADTIAALRRIFPRTQFVWLMGADNLGQIAKWERWQRIFHLVPVAVFARPGYSKVMAGVAARVFATARRPMGSAKRLAATTPPSWVFFHTRLHPASASEIRARSRRPRAGA